MAFSVVPLKRERLHDQITRYLAVEILRGKLRDGEAGASSETELCKLLKVSRTVLRESVKVLAAKGLVELRPKVGLRVRPRDDWNLLDPDMLMWQHEAGADDVFIRNLSEVRLVAETAAAQLAAVRATETDLAEIRAAYEKMAATGDSDKAGYIAADLEFHGAIFVSCHNDLLRQMSTTIAMALRGTHRFTGHLSAEVGLVLHKAVADAICARDGARARAATQQLVIQAAHTLYQLFHPESARLPDAWRDLMLAEPPPIEMDEDPRPRKPPAKRKASRP